MLGEQRVCAVVYAGAFAVNLALCVVLIPLFGMAGAAIATASALIFESILLFVVTKNRLGFHVFVWGRKRMTSAARSPSTAQARRRCDGRSSVRVEWRPLAELGAIAAEWRELAARALEPNVFYEPAFALAAAPVFGARRRRRPGLVARAGRRA